MILLTTLLITILTTFLTIKSHLVIINGIMGYHSTEQCSLMIMISTVFFLLNNIDFRTGASKSLNEIFFTSSSGIFKGSYGLHILSGVFQKYNFYQSH